MRVAIAGAGKVGRSIARELLGFGHEVLLIDREADLARPGVVGGPFKTQMTSVEKWSWKFWPTPSRSCTTATPTSRR